MHLLSSLGLFELFHWASYHTNPQYKTISVSTHFLIPATWISDIARVSTFHQRHVWIGHKINSKRKGTTPSSMEMLKKIGWGKYFVKHDNISKYANNWIMENILCKCIAYCKGLQVRVLYPSIDNSKNGLPKSITDMDDLYTVLSIIVIHISIPISLTFFSKWPRIQ